MRLLRMLLWLSCWLPAGPALAAPPTLAGRLVLKLRADAPPAAASLRTLGPALAALHATSLTQKFPLSQVPSNEVPGSVNLRLLYEVRVPARLSLAKARAQLLATGVVEYVEPLYIRAPQYQPNDPLADSTAAGNEYHLRLTQAYRAWDFTRGDTSLVIGVTDTGIRYTHEDLQRQVKYNYADPINGIDDDGDGYVDNFRGWDFSNNTNDPMYEDYTGHGTQVSGIVAGQADNGKGLAGVGFRCKFLPLQMFPGTPTGSFAGYEAIVYAADHGCKVINMSWGGAGGYSRFEQDVCTYAAVNRDAVLVAAAGNTPSNVLFYPASYDHVLSVSATDAADGKATFATYNRRVDLVAPGVDIIIAYGRPTTTAAGPPDADYWHGSGTSFAAPQVAGAAALVRVRFPQLTAEQVLAQLRRTTDASIYALPANTVYQGYLGTGRLNIARAVAALTQREARVVSSTFSPAQPAGYAPGDTLRLAATVRNLLLPATGLTLTVRSLSPYLTVRQGTFAVGNLATLGQASNAGAPFRLAVAGSVPLNTTATLQYHFVGDNGYESDQYVDVLLNPDFVQLDAGDISMSLTSRGNLAYDDLTGAGGRGLSYRGSTPLLSEGGLLLATSPTRVADHLRASPGTARQSFFTLAQVRRLAPGPRADQEARGTFRDSLPSATAPRSVGVRVRQHGQSWAAPAARRNVILLDYSLRNLTADTLKPLYVGVFTDWDLPGETGRNVARWDSVNRVSYAYDPVAPRFYAGVQVLGPHPPGVYALDNAAPAGSPIYLGDGFSPAEKFLALSGGFNRAHREAGTAAQGTDVAQVVSTLVPRLAPGDSATVAFAVLVAPTLPELQAAAQAATAIYQQALATAPAVGASPTWQLYPNPTTGRLHITLPAGLGPATAQVLDALGRPVATAALPGGGGELSLAPLARGLYLVRIVGTSLVQRVVRE
ncbi:S8 family peptidase [Hymenobacter cheonanensis]|uniref:S8 family peptidase n=1 Tax=Hymenobacter sp. CA2-7 TaxID=3063993 RepID=UPI0027130877|nr:S8 family peptidase [Hymenobacter sp. CA2-7]MDO7887929.1 S8 family peptidase [Hymenobacter sp. CA2-7]